MSFPRGFFWSCAEEAQYEADTSQLRSSFESYGDIKNWFDIIQKRGMIFITYVRYFSIEGYEQLRLMG